MEECRTTLYDMHMKYGGKMVPFAGFLLPVQYEKTGVIREHMAVRTGCGLFDVSHMGEILCEGEGALDNLNYLLTNDFTGMYDGQARYSPMCNEKGGVVDDLIVYKIKDNHYFIVVNAANKDKDFAWMLAHQRKGACFTDISGRVGQIALQGPAARKILGRIAAPEWIPETYYSCKTEGSAAGMRCLISKSGYTGEEGYELYVDSKEAPVLWESLMEAGKEEGLVPCGLGARDTLRLEAAMPLYGHEMNDEITPLETGLQFAVKRNKKDFVGKEALDKAGEPARKRVGLKVTGRGIIREGAAVYIGEEQIGWSTSGTHAPFLGYPVAMALVQAHKADVGSRVEAKVRGRRVEAEVVKLPFYKRQV